MEKIITLVKPYNGKMEITPSDLIQIQLDSHSSYSTADYIEDLISNFKMTKEEARAEIKKFFHLPN